MKKILIILLAAVIIMTFSFVPVFAEEETGTAISDGEVITSGETEAPEPQGNETISQGDGSSDVTGSPEGTEPADTADPEAPADPVTPEVTEEPAEEDVTPAPAPVVKVEKPVRQVIKSLQPGNHKLTVLWTPDKKKTAKYEIWIAKDDEFTKALKKYNRSAPVDMFTKKSLKNGVTYYVKVRTYYKVNGKKYYGRWSKVKKVKVKSTAIYSNTSTYGVPEIQTLKSKDDGDLKVLVNKYHALSSNYVPEDLVNVSSSYCTYGSAKLEKSAYKAFKKMYKAARAKGLNFKICSGYRSYSTQRYLFNNYIYSRGYKVAFMLSAYPGRSEHQTGYAMDLLTGRNGWAMGDSFGNTKEGKWLAKHCAEYGFILRYPKGKSDITGYSFEPWHFRYIGKTAAKKIMSEDITLEEYLGKLPPDYEAE